MTACRYLIKWKGYSEDEKTWEPLEVRLARNEQPMPGAIALADAASHLTEPVKLHRSFE